MSINLDDYKELLEDLEPESLDLLHSVWPDATKVFSPRGLDNYLKGASAINVFRNCR
jgi:nitric oxide reductase NorD protein